MGPYFPLGGGSKISEFQTFFWVVMAGVAVGIFFDLYRSLRRYLRWGQITTWVGDILFSLITFVILYRFFLRANTLDFRIYILWGSVLGLFVYLRFLSRILIRFYLQFFRLTSYLLWLLQQGLKIPVKAISLLMRPPYAFLHWFSFLLYRMTEALVAQPFKQIATRLSAFWDQLFPPRTKG